MKIIKPTCLLAFSTLLLTSQAFPRGKDIKSDYKEGSFWKTFIELEKGQWDTERNFT